MSVSSSGIATGGETNGTALSESSTEEEEESYQLHQAAFHGDVPRVREILEKRQVEPNARDKHGETGKDGIHIQMLL